MTWVTTVWFFLLARGATATSVNTNDIKSYNAFASSATIEDFESVGGLTALGLNDYAHALNSSISVPPVTQLSLHIGGQLFHSGGGSFSDPFNDPITPAVLLSLGGNAAGDAQSAGNVVGSLEINTTTCIPTSSPRSASSTSCSRASGPV